MSEAKTTPKGFFQLYQTKVRENIGPLRTESGQLTDNDGKKSKTFNDYFLSVFNKENLDVILEVKKIYKGSIGNMHKKNYD